MLRRCHVATYRSAFPLQKLDSPVTAQQSRGSHSHWGGSVWRGAGVVDLSMDYSSATGGSDMYFYRQTQTENINVFCLCLVSECTGWIFFGCVVTRSHLPRNIVCVRVCNIPSPVLSWHVDDTVLNLYGKLNDNIKISFRGIKSCCDILVHPVNWEVMFLSLTVR